MMVTKTQSFDIILKLLVSPQASPNGFSMHNLE